MGSAKHPRTGVGRMIAFIRKLTEPSPDPFGRLGTFLGYVIAILGIAMLIYSIR